MQTQELQIKIGKKIKELRNINGWTQEQVSEQLDICRNTYSDIELGKSDISLSRLVQLANFYKVDVDYFVSEDKRVVFYLTGNQKAEANNNKVENQCHEYHGDFAEEKLQMQLEMRDKELTMKDREIENLKEIIALLKREPA